MKGARKNAIYLFKFSPSHKYKKNKVPTTLRIISTLYFFSVFRVYAAFALATIALKASGWFIAKSANTLRLISIPALCNAPINLE